VRWEEKEIRGGKRKKGTGNIWNVEVDTLLAAGERRNQAPYHPQLIPTKAAPKKGGKEAGKKKEREEGDAFQHFCLLKSQRTRRGEKERKKNPHKRERGENCR